MLDIKDKIILYTKLDEILDDLKDPKSLMEISKKASFPFTVMRVVESHNPNNTNKVGDLIEIEGIYDHNYLGLITTTYTMYKGIKIYTSATYKSFILSE